MVLKSVVLEIKEIGWIEEDGIFLQIIKAFKYAIYVHAV